MTGTTSMDHSCRMFIDEQEDACHPKSFLPELGERKNDATSARESRKIQLLPPSSQAQPGLVSAIISPTATISVVTATTVACEKTSNMTNHLETIDNTNLIRNKTNLTASNPAASSTTSSADGGGGGGMIKRPSISSQDGMSDADYQVFHQRLYEEKGVAIRKINQYGKPNLRYVRCIPVTDTMDETASRKSNRSMSSRRSNSSQQPLREVSASERASHPKEKKHWALFWGKKNKEMVRLDQFVSVRKGKHTDRTRKSTAATNRLLSLMTADPSLHLDIEAPSKSDRDKFARAFSRFLSVPLVEEDSASTTASTQSATPDLPRSPEPTSPVISTSSKQEGGFYPPPLPPSPPLIRVNSGHSSNANARMGGGAGGSQPSSSNVSSTQRGNISQPSSVSVKGAVLHIQETTDVECEDDDSHSHVSSITGHGYDAELVEELHHALNEMRTELEQSRTEAARAVKVAEQAIQSAEKSSSNEWQNTVTHKAAEAAAQAQKKCAEALAKQRLAEDRLESERKTAAFWRKQAEVAEEEAGTLQTKAAAAEVQRAAMETQLESLRRALESQIQRLRERLEAAEGDQKESYQALLEKNRVLEVELEKLYKQLQEREVELDEARSKKLMGFIGGKKKKGTPSKPRSEESLTRAPESFPAQKLTKLQEEATLVRQQFDLFRKATGEELAQLPEDSKKWVTQVMGALQSSQQEVNRLQQRLAYEAASRRKLLQEVQDLRGTVRVYCRIKPLPELQDAVSAVELASQDTLMFHRKPPAVNGDTSLSGVTSYQFDRVFAPDVSQHDVYREIEDVCLGALDGYSICLMAYGQSGSGKTHTLLGDVEFGEQGDVSILNHGIQLQTIKELFSITELRQDRYEDKFTFSIVEVYNDRLSDLLAGTDIGETKGETILAERKSSSSSSRRRSQRSADDASSTKPGRLEIRTDVHGETVVQGAVSIAVSSFDEVYQAWNEGLEKRRESIVERGEGISERESSAHVIATLKIFSSNIATGVGSVGKIQFVDLAGADLIPRDPTTSPKTSPQRPASKTIMDSNDWCFANKSIETLGEVIDARSQFTRNVPYRNSTLTHLLRDSLDHDTKVLMIACVSSESKDARNTLATLRFATHMSRVTIGKATKHTISPP